MKFIELHFISELGMERSRLPPFLGATLRGAFGHLLKQTVCQVENVLCQDCLLQSTCPYPAVFEGLAPRDRSILKKYPQLPQPFVLIAPFPQSFKDRSRSLQWGIRLFGLAIKYWPYVAHTFMTAGQRGIGRTKCKYKIEQITDGINGNIIWSTEPNDWKEPQEYSVPFNTAGIPETCTLRWKFETPVKLRHKNPLSGIDIILAGRRRFRILNHFYGQPEFNLQSDADPFFQTCDFDTRQSAIRSWGFSRFSGRQKRKIDLNGLIGEIEITGPWGKCGPWLPAIPFLNLGKATSFGFGRLQWEILET